MNWFLMDFKNMFEKAFFLFVFILSFASLSNSNFSTPDPFKDFVITSVKKDDDGCQYLLESFATVTAHFTFCAVRHARPIKLCTQCLENYSLVIEVHEDILNLENEAGEVCKEKLINLDRLQVVDNGFNYITGLWKRANCNYCFNLDKEGNPTTDMNENTKEIIHLHNITADCIETHRNDTVEVLVDPLVCNICKEKYLSMNQRYNELKDQIFCMDIVDMINTTRSMWSNELGCCLDRKKPEIIFLLATAIVSILPFIFYLSAFKFAPNKEQKLSQQNRWAADINAHPSTSYLRNPD